MKNTPTLSLHIPEPEARPGDEASFDRSALPPAGSVPRPPTDVCATTIRDLSFSLIRVLDEDFKAVGPWNPRLSPDVMRSALRYMMMTRAYDERMYRAQRQGKTSFYMKSTGEEATNIAYAFALHRDDMCFPAYRQQGLLLARGYPMLTMMNQVYSNAHDPGKGRNLPVMYSSREHSFFTISGNLGTQFPQAVGWAMASAYKGDTRIAASWIGEGTTAEGDFHQAMNFAAVYRAPVILNVVNNQWAISSFQGIAGGEASTFASRAIGYGFPGLRVDGNDFLAVYAVAEWAAERARNNHGPTLVELYTYRGEGHSTSDDPSRYRPSDEWKAWPLGDPIERLKRHLIGLDEWSDEKHAALGQEMADLVRDTQKEAEAVGTLQGGEQPSPGTMFEDVFEETPWHIRRQRQQMGV
ncbi:MAG: 3-methyl-2-oxobutanoate dehydrogenase (2-methylpropanoyl-transferring) subunit alpha [Alphaproteobacteria bacterium]|nr:3-methyl-2-oxobutanoate dehydrogenase (2-methylpropanoyl-transferring) subunit alpha [Alphaproteobacteria bacterium]MBL6936962.1 3-methyl-2-oxobutanoate dehydrogenase (2-methylpropanoyl-transferring) subunit alpha [Alphaproteobacteria bacterium]MBL7097731.1 3-methyl-2-oxobutanoate dehydrogenase (2-methylpropanoyl-transferring) subunit alpha [Alphaproteobacteria bacterium]